MFLTVLRLRQKKVSLAWVAREAVAKYFEEKWPLFRERE